MKLVSAVSVSTSRGVPEMTGRPVGAKFVLVTADVAAELSVDSGLEPLGAQPIRGHTPVEVLGWPGPSVDPNRSLE